MKRGKGLFMATGTMRRDASPPPPPSASLPGGERWDFIEDQIDRTRSQVKWTDFGASLLLLAAGMLLYFLTMALIDHWFFDLGAIGRSLAFVVLIGGVGAYAFTQLWPLAMQSINPVYVAHSIEQGQPDLKNSLVNFLFLRGDSHPVHQVVYDALEKRAAEDLSQVPPETAVDRSRLIQVGYVLVGVVVVLALYLVLSPKDPLRSVARVLAPWLDIWRPSWVEMYDVQPGNTSTYQGKNVTISCTVRKLPTDEPVVLTYSTADGQIVDRAVTLKESTKDHYEIELPPDGLGLQHDVTYQVRAGDAEAGPYTIKVLPALSFVVEKVVYDVPEYTGDEDRTVLREGDLRELEGTRVTIHAKANHPIQSASVEFDPVFAAISATDKEKSLPKGKMQVQSMAIDPKNPLEAKVTFPLLMDSERKRPWHATYQLRFSNDKGDRNENPVQYGIEVTPDLAPRVEIFTPVHREVEVPINAASPIELRAIDPDYKLTRISLRAASRGKTILDEKLFSKPEGHIGQAIPPAFVFAPSKLGLVVGDVVLVWGEAADNRTSPQSRKPEPNVATTDKFTFKIVGPVEKPPQEGDGGADMNPGGEKSPNDPAGKPPANPENRAGNPPPRGGEKPNPGAGNPEGMGKPMPGTTPNGMNPNTMPPNEAKPEGMKPTDPRNQPGGANSRPMPGEKKPNETPMNPEEKKPEEKKPPEKKPGTMRPEGGAPGDKVDMPMRAEEKTGDSQGSKGENPMHKNGNGGGGDMGNGAKPQDTQQGKKPGEGKKGSDSSNQRNQGKKPDKGSSTKKGPNGQEGGGAEGMEEGGEEGSKEQEGKSDGGAGTKASGKPGSAEAKGQNPDSTQGGGGDPTETGSSPAGSSERQPGEKPRQGGGFGPRPEPKLKNDGSQDGDIIEKLNNFLKEKGELPPEGNPMGGGGQPNPQEGANPKKPEGAQGMPPGGNTNPDMGQKPGENPQAKPAGGSPMGDAGMKPMGTGMKPAGQDGMKPGGNEGQAPMPGGPMPTGSKPAGQDGMKPGGNEGQAPMPGGPMPAGSKPMGGKPGDMPMTGGNDSQNPSASGMKPGGMNPGGADASKPMPNGGQQGGMPMDGMGKPGDQGAGKKEGGQKGGAPEDQGGKQQGGKQPKPGSGGEGKSEEGKSPAQGKKGSDSQGDSGGDKKGNGEAGGGQSGMKPGNDSPGSSSPGDEGNGTAEGAGKGETGKKAGDGQIANQPTGNPGKEEGKGSTKKKGGDQAGPGDPAQQTKSGEKKPGEGKPKSQGGKDPSGEGEEALGGGGPNNKLKMHEGDPSSRGPGSGKESEATEEANAEYARKVTQLTLDKLRQQADKPDPELLKKLGANPDDKEFLRRFLDRWEKMYRDAAQPGDAGKKGKQELDEALKSLGLRPQGDKVRASDNADDTVRDRDVSSSRPPTEYERLFKAYNRATRELKKAP